MSTYKKVKYHKLAEQLMLLDVNFYFTKPVTPSTGDITLGLDDYCILLDGSTAAITATLPTAVGISGRVYNIKSIDDTFLTDVATSGSELIDDSADNVILTLHESITVISDGEKWWII